MRSSSARALSARIVVVGLSVCLVATALLLWPSSARAARVRSLNLERLVAQADRIFVGRCVEVRAMRDPVLEQTVTVLTFVPERVAKGPASLHGRLTVKVLGDQSAAAAPGMETEGIPRFEVGETSVLFLYPDSGIGLTSPVGFGQGRFRVRPDRSGRAVAENGFRNEGLMEGFSPSARARLGDDAERYRGGKGISPDALLDMARALAQ